MASGLYESPDDVLLHALRTLDDDVDAVADIREGMADELAGRTMSIADAERELRHELGFDP